MTLKRKIYAKLVEWKTKSNGTSALLIDGARRVGKSFVAEEFAKREYESYILIDFARATQEIKDLFVYDSGDLNLFFQKLSLYYTVTLHERRSLIIFDEVQQFPPARQFIKYLVADGRYDYLETGSLIRLKKNTHNIVIPSEEEHIEMFPMDFEEFLWAMGDETTIPVLKNFFEKRMPLGDVVHRKVMGKFKEYMLVGGMPQSVLAYLPDKSFERADRAKRNILTLYREDVSKFAEGYEDRVFAIFDNIPSQLSKKEKKFKLSDLKKEARFRTFKDAFLWLNEAMIVNNCYNVTNPAMGLALSAEESTLKCYMGDTGLLVKMLRCTGRRLYFYSRSDAAHRENHMEIDFLISEKKKITPIEVKSSRYQKHTSLDKFMVKFKGRYNQPYILYTKDIMEKDGILHLPVYMALFL